MSIFVGVQFHPWFQFYFPLFPTHYHTSTRTPPLLQQNISIIVVSRAESNVNEQLQYRFFSFALNSAQGKLTHTPGLRGGNNSAVLGLLSGTLNWDAAELAFLYVLPIVNNLDLPSAFAER